MEIKMKIKDLIDKKIGTTIIFKEQTLDVLKYIKKNEKVNMSILVEHYVNEGLKKDFPEIVKKIKTME